MRLNARLRIVAAAVAAVAVTSACSSGSSGSDNADKSSGSGSSSSSKSGGSVKLTYWAWAPNMDKVVTIWNKEHPEIQVTVNKQDGGDPAVTKLLTAVKAGSGAPDLMQAEYQALPTMVASDALADISSETKDLKSHFADGVWNAVTLGSDAVYAIPQDSGPMEFYYRDDIFKKYGVEVPKTWDEYAKAAEKIHAADPKLYLGTFSATDPGWFTGLAQQAGASWWGIDGDAWSVSIADAATKKVADYWGGLVQKGVIDNKPMYTPEWNKALNSGTQVGWVSAIWAPGVLSGNAPDTAGKWKMAPMPQWTAGENATGNWGGSSTAVTKQSKHVKEATEFITWLNTDQEAVDALVKISGIYPADTQASTKALSQAPDFFKNQPDFYTVAAGIAKGARSFTFGPNVNVAYSAYNDAFGKAAESKSQAAFTAAIDTMQKTTLGDLKKSGYTVKE